MFFFDMDNKLWTETAHCHSNHVRVGNSSFDTSEETKKSVIGKYIVQIFVSEQKDALLFFAHIVDFYEFCGQNNGLCISK
jgi:hypothetical protein